MKHAGSMHLVWKFRVAVSYVPFGFLELPV